MACNMGGMGFIENNKAECMQSVLINTNLLIACKENQIKKYFFSSSACAYNKTIQQNVFIDGLKENDAYPADPEDGYGWEKLFSERMCRHFTEDFGLQTRVLRYHNVYGPEGTEIVTAGFEMAYKLDYGFRNEHHGEALAPIESVGFDTTIVDLNNPVI